MPPKRAIVNDNSFDVLPVEPVWPDEPVTSHAPGATANARHTRSTSAQSNLSLSPLQRIENYLKEAITLIYADKHKVPWWAGVSERLKDVLKPARTLATELAQSSTPSSATANPSTSPSPKGKESSNVRSTGTSPASAPDSPVPSLSASDIEAAVARVLPAILQKELARTLQDRDHDHDHSRLSASQNAGARSCADTGCHAHASHGSPHAQPLPTLPQAIECDATVSLASVAPDHAVRSLSEAEVKAAVDAALARSSPSGNTTTSLLGVKKLANGNLRLRTTSEDARDALVKESGTWLPALAEHAQLVRDLYTVEIRAVPVVFRPSEAYAVRGLCQANAHVFPDVSNIVTIRWLRELKDGHDKQTSSLLVVVNGQDTFARAVHHGVAIHGRLCDVSPYIPSPTQCYFCQGFGHTVTACPRKKNNLNIICARCAGPHATSACSCPHSPACSSRRSCTHIAVKCANCGGNHKSFSIDCPVRRRAAADVARSPKYARALTAYSSSLNRAWGTDAKDTRRSLPFSSSPRAGSAWCD